MIETGKYKLLCGDALAVLRTLPADSIDCCITSPPYYGLRDYGIGGQIGLEPTPVEYIARLVDVFREVRRVLKPEGTLWVNLGDSYSSQAGPQVAQTKWLVKGASDGQNAGASRKPAPGLKPKDLIGIPWMLAFALRDDGWWLRQDIIWHKPNPMPESVRDRCTKAHEYVFLLAKSARYWWDVEAIAEPSTTEDIRRPYAPGQVDKRGSGHDRGGGTSRSAVGAGAARNKRSVWTIATRPSTEPHFATFPPELPSLCIRAGCPPGGVVLDPFAGICTTGTASLELGRRFVGIELSPMYLNLGRRKLLIQTAMGEPDVEGVEDENHE